MNTLTAGSQKMIKFEMHEELTDEVLQRLWDQNISMDDWDYVLFLEEKYKDRFYLQEEDNELMIVNSTSFYIDSLLQGCCANKWFYVKDFMGRSGILGVAYHA